MPNQIDPSLLLMSLFGQQPGGQQQRQPFDFAGLLTAMRNDPQGDANKGYIPGVDNKYSPFSNGFFQDQNQRIGNETARLGQEGITGVQAGLAPFQANPERPQTGQALPNPVEQQHPFAPTIPSHSPAGGLEGMINPNLPDAQKYGDANTFSAIPGKSSLPPGARMGDEHGPVMPQQNPFAFSQKPQLTMFGPQQPEPPKTKPRPKGGFKASASPFQY